MSDRVPFTVATWNMGNGTRKDLLEVATAADVLGLQEASDRVDDIDWLLSRGEHLALRFDAMPGGKATPVLYKKAAVVATRGLFVPLLKGGTPVGEGKGPDHAKAKNLQGGYFIHRESRRRVAVGNLHCLAGQKGGNRRRLLSRAMVLNARREFADYGGVPILLGDFNADPDVHTLDPLYNAGWTSNHDEGGWLGTHGNWTPDQIWWLPDGRRPGGKRLAFRDHRTIATHSDHDALVVDFGLKKRGER